MKEETGAPVPEAQGAHEGRSENLADAIDIGYLTLTEACFYTGPGGFTGLRYNGKEYKRVQLRRAMPVKHPAEYISVADHENKEIGMIRAISDLSAGQLRIVQDELDHRYYCPEILEIKSVHDKLGYVYMEMKLLAGGEQNDYTPAIKDVNKNIRLLGEDRLIIFDVDGNRYLVSSLQKLDKKSLKRLEPYML